MRAVCGTGGEEGSGRRVGRPHCRHRLRGPPPQASATRTLGRIGAPRCPLGVVVTPTGDDSFAGTAYEGSPEGWWTRYGGVLDVRSGVVHIPPEADLPVSIERWIESVRMSEVCSAPACVGRSHESRTSGHVQSLRIIVQLDRGCPDRVAVRCLGRRRGVDDRPGRWCPLAAHGQWRAGVRGSTSTSPRLSAGCSARGRRRRAVRHGGQARMVRPGPLAEWTTPTTMSVSWAWSQ